MTIMLGFAMLTPTCMYLPQSDRAHRVPDKWEIRLTSNGVILLSQGLTGKSHLLDEIHMSSAPQSPLYTIISLSLIVFGLVAVGLISGLIPGVFPAKPGADESAMQVEAKAEAASTTGAVIGNLAGMATANSGAVVDQAGKSGATSPALMAEAGRKIHNVDFSTPNK
jgi:hypothetical protein